jgi:hypothetical protein
MRTDDGTSFYKSHSRVTDPGHQRGAFANLPPDPRTLSAVIQGLGIYDVVAADFYGYDIPEERRGEIHIRTVEGRLNCLLALDSRPLAVPRPPDRRIAGRCHQFTLLLVAVLREKGIPARSRCGFGAYFNASKFEDHWVCEYWDADRRRWVLVDAQLDEVWRTRLGIGFDIVDVPRNQFLTASDAWERCRRGETDPSRFGISFANLYGLWFIAGSLVRDLAALNKMEMLPWDIWGAQPRPNQQLDAEQLAFFDELAALTREPDDTFDKLRERYETEPRLRVPPAVFNALLDRLEAV